MKNHMAVDQYGDIFYNLGKYPRKELLTRLCRKHADKMYQDDKDGTTKHVGWIISGRWLTVYEVKPMENKV